MRDRIAVAKILGIAVHPDDADSVLTELRPELERTGIPLYLAHGTSVWSPASASGLNMSASC